MSPSYCYKHLSRQAKKVHYDTEEKLNSIQRNFRCQRIDWTKIYSVSRATKVDDNVAGHYGGTFYSNRFRANQPVQLYDLGFFGPANLQKAICNYNVHIELFEPAADGILASCASNLIAKNIIDVSVGQNENVFYVSFGNRPISLERFKWYLIQFKLEGPRTKCAANVLYNATVPVDNGNGINGDMAEFSFSEGSKQMPILRFIK